MHFEALQNNLKLSSVIPYKSRERERERGQKYILTLGYRHSVQIKQKKLILNVSIIIICYLSKMIESPKSSKSFDNLKKILCSFVFTVICYLAAN